MASGMRDFSLTLVSKVGMVFLAIATQSCLAWGLGLEGRGAYAVCVVIPTMLSVLFMLGCDVAVLYEVASGKQSLSEGVIHIGFYALGASSLAITVGALCVYLRVPMFAKAAPGDVYLSLSLVPLSFLTQVLILLLTSIRDFLISAIFTIAAGILGLTLAALFVLAFDWGVTGGVLALVLMNVLVITGVLTTMRCRHGLHLARPSLSRIRGMLHYGIRYYVGKLSNMANVQLGTIILALFADKAEIGLFAVASQATIRVMMIPDALTTVLFPRVASTTGGRPELVAQSARITFVICGVLLATLAALATPIVWVIFSPEFLGSVPLIRILILGVLLRCASKLFVPYLNGTNHPGIASIAVGAGVLTNLGLVWLLLPRIGLNGAAVAMGASYVVSAVILTSSFCRLSGLGFLQTFWPRKSDWEPIMRIHDRLRGSSDTNSATKIDAGQE